MAWILEEWSAHRDRVDAAADELRAALAVPIKRHGFVKRSRAETRQREAEREAKRQAVARAQASGVEGDHAAKEARRLAHNAYHAEYKRNRLIRDKAKAPVRPYRKRAKYTGQGAARLERDLGRKIT